MSDPKLIITGGGTGGHVLAGVAVADEWRARFPGAAVSFVGGQGGIEEKLVPRAGYRLDLLRIGALKGKSVLVQLKTAAQLPLAFIRSAEILLKERPDAVLGVGGYASGPFLLTARLLSILGLLRCQSAILEQNSVPGFTNRVLGKLVTTVFCAFPGTEKSFPGRETFITGNPIRSSMKRLPSATTNPFTIFAFGGSQGAVGINNLMLESVALLKELYPTLRVIHQTGERDFERVREAYSKLEFPSTQLRVEKFIYDMPEAYAQATILVCRSGSSTLSEVAAVGRAAVLVPFPFASDNHQQKNAEVFMNAGAAWMMIQSQTKAGDLTELVRRLAQAPAELQAKEKAVTAFYKPDAAQQIVKVMLSRAQGRS